MPITPWWIITALDDDSEERPLGGGALAALLDRQLLHWSLVGGVMRSPEAPRWWRVDTLAAPPPAGADDIHRGLEEFLYNPLREGSPAPPIAGDIDASQLAVAVVGDVRSERTRAYLHCVGRLVRPDLLKKYGGLTRRVVAVLFLPQDTNKLAANREAVKFLTDLHTMMQHEAEGERPFDSVIFLQDGNASQSNPYGYNALTQEQVKELVAQSLFHLMIEGGDFLGQGRRQFGAAYFSVGADAIFYDWRNHQRQLAREAGAELLRCFLGAAHAPFVSEPEAETAASGVRRALEPQSLFERMAFDSSRPSFDFGSRIWEMARDRRRRHLSPWALFNTALLEVYFFVHLRFLPFRLSEYARIFLASRLEGFARYLRRRGRALWEAPATEYGLRATVDEAVAAALKSGQARSVEQLLLVVRKIREACDLKNLESKLAAVDEFRRLEVFAVPDEVREFYDRADPLLAPAEEARLFERLGDAVRLHPIPLALFLRAALLGVMLALLGDRLLDWLSRARAVNVDWALAVPGLTLAVLFALPLLSAALLRYKVLTLNELRKRTREYIGAVLRHAQTRARDMIRAEMIGLGRRGQQHCDELTEGLERLRELLAYPEVESYTYEPTTFHRPLLDTLEVPRRGNRIEILATRKPDYQISVDGRSLYFRDCGEEHKHLLLNKLLNRKAEPSERRVWELVRELVSGEPDPAAAERFGLSLRRFAESLYDDVRDMRLDWWMMREPGEQRARVLELLRTLAAPPVVFHQGASEGLPATAEWKYEDTERLSLVVGNDGRQVFEQSGDGSLLSLAVYRPLPSLDSISTVRAMYGSREVLDHDQRACDAARVFTLAHTRLPGAAACTLVSAVSGSAFAAPAECAAAVAAFLERHQPREQGGERPAQPGGRPARKEQI
ncbi:MAG TPA: hypothetical protein VF591_16650 [Pyrinomonadaceae bacterium]|jgi:hypothetical protein